ncbi:MAG: DUF2283 domain-containing protein [Ginsengibacter sp.]
MNIQYDSKSDLLYLRFDLLPATVINKRVSDDIVLDIGPDEKIIGIEIMDASKNINLDKILPVEFSVANPSLSPL